jgi:hypothetical protein
MQETNKRCRTCHSSNIKTLRKSNINDIIAEYQWCEDCGSLQEKLINNEWWRRTFKSKIKFSFVTYTPTLKKKTDAHECPSHDCHVGEM